MAERTPISASLYAWLAVVPGLLLALWLRLPDLERKPMHTDEAVQAETTGRLLDKGLASYEYDPVEYHGPTLYYLTLPVAWLRGQDSYVRLDEVTLRLVPAIFGIALLLWLPLLRGHLGTAGVAVAALLLATSPVYTYYSRYYIQESMLVFFSLGLAAGLARWVAGGGMRWAVVAGLNAGLMHATKETCILTFAAMAGAAIVVAWSARPIRLPERWRRDAWVFTAAAILIAGVFLSSFLTHPRGPIDSVLTFFHYAGKAVENGHEKPWWWYADILTWNRVGTRVVFHELGLLVPGLLALGTLVVWRTGWRSRPAALFGAVWFVLLAGVYSVILYKTPWLVLNPLLPLALLAGMGADLLWSSGQGLSRKVVCAGMILPAVWQGVNVTKWVTGRFASDERNPYAYSHPIRDIVDGCRTLVKMQEQSSEPLVVHVLADEYWPIPWYLRSLPAVGYWDAGQPAGDADIWLLDDRSLEAWNPAGKPATYDRGHGLRPGVRIQVRMRNEIWSAFRP
jgi:uncharacterized protein (TIGR03663 family)